MGALNILSLIGTASCLVASTYLYLKGFRAAGLLLAFGFLFHVQSVFYALYGPNIQIDACLYSGQGYFDCLPLSAQVSTVFSFLGPFVLAAGIFLIGKRKIGGNNAS